MHLLFSCIVIVINVEFSFLWLGCKDFKETLPAKKDQDGDEDDRKDILDDTSKIAGQLNCKEATSSAISGACDTAPQVIIYCIGLGCLYVDYPVVVMCVCVWHMFTGNDFGSAPYCMAFQEENITQHPETVGSHLMRNQN